MEWPHDFLGSQKLFKKWLKVIRRRAVLEGRLTGNPGDLLQMELKTTGQFLNECSIRQHLQFQMVATLLKSLNFEIQKSCNETSVNCTQHAHVYQPSWSMLLYINATEKAKSLISPSPLISLLNFNFLLPGVEVVTIHNGRT